VVLNLRSSKRIFEETKKSFLILESESRGVSACTIPSQRHGIFPRTANGRWGDPEERKLNPSQEEFRALEKRQSFRL
jgi:hypothetical protein